MISAMPSAAAPNPAPPARSDAADADDLTFATPAFPFDAGPYARFPPPLGVAGPELRTVVRRAIIAVAIAWLPLAVLAIAEGVAIRPNPRESLFLDVSAYARYVVALPLLIIAEYVTLPQLGRIASHLDESSLLPVNERSHYHALILSTRRWASSPWAAAVILVLAYISTIQLTGIVYPRTISTWSDVITAGEHRVTLAGRWRLFVSQPLDVLRKGLWVWRAFVWAHFLYDVSRVHLRLVASHPDHMGGLRFVNASIRAFPIVGFAMATGMAGNVAAKVLFDGQSILEFTHAIVIVEVIVVILFVGPLLALSGPLRRVRSLGILSYGELASDVSTRFEQQWLRTDRGPDDNPLHAADFSAMADLYAVVSNVREIKLVPVELRGMMPLVVMTLLPFVPLLLLAAPLSEVLRFAVNLLL